MAGEGNPSGYAIIPTSAAGGVIMGAGTNNTVAKFTGSDTIGDSSVTDNGTVVTVTTNLIDSGLTASQLVVTDSSKQLASNGSITTNALVKSASSGASLAASAVSDDGVAVTISSNLIDSGLTASRLVIANSSKQLASNGALTTNTVPKAASSGASLSDSNLADTGTVVSSAVAVQHGRHLVSGFTPTVAAGAVTGQGSTGTIVLEGNSTDEAGKITITAGGSGIGSTGNITLTFSTGSAYGTGTPVCVIGLENGTGTWPNGSSGFAETTSNTSVSIRWNSATSAASGNLNSGSTYIVHYICFGRL